MLGFMDAIPSQEGKGDCHPQFFCTDQLETGESSSLHPIPHNTPSQHSDTIAQCSARNIHECTPIDAGNGSQATLAPDPPYAKRSLLRATEAAIRRRYPIVKARRKAVVDEAFMLLTSSKSEAIRLRAASILLTAERADNARLIAAQYKPGQGNVTVNIDVHSKEAAVFGVIDSQAFAAAARRVREEQEDRNALLPAPDQEKS
jgi:hypothetical protein